LEKLLGESQAKLLIHKSRILNWDTTAFSYNLQSIIGEISINDFCFLLLL
jgi:hypothetical protein